MDEDIKKQLNLHDAIADKTKRVVDRCIDLFPGEWEEIARRILYTNEQIVTDHEIITLMEEIKRLEENGANEINPWVKILEQK